ncbi:MAG: glycosyltransferase [Mogibacterium sp.]|nr:glycosyltransferase [Mogibacterium sp.]
MRILHLCLACFYIDGYNYQENVLPRISKENGHDVMIIASTETYIDNAELGYIEPREYITEFGVPIKRLPYKHILSDKVSQKLRKYIGLYEEIEKFRPDIIYSHDISFASVDEVAEYVKNHREVVFLADTHSADYNSGQNWVSLNILHRAFYKRHILKALPYIKKYYYIGPAERDFSIENYGIPESLMEFLPLGGIIPDEEDYKRKRGEYRAKLNINDELLLVHSGKLSAEKKTAELLRAFKAAENLNARMVIIGSIPDETKSEIFELIESDERIEYLGWQAPEYLLGCLCAADLYCQPGSPSATLQNAICCGSAIMAQPMEAYRMLDKGNFFWVENEEGISEVLSSISENPKQLEDAKKASVKCAREFLDYREMERKIVSEGNGHRA